MKKENIIRISLIILMGLVFVLVSSCKKDKEEEIANYFKVGGEYVELSEGILVYFGMDTDYEGYNFDLYLITSGIGHNQNDGPTGSGKIIYFELFTSSSSTLADGDYNFDNNSNIPPIGTFDYADYCLDWSDANDNNSYVEFASGKVTVKKEGSEYIINITGKDEFANTIKGYFKGILTKYDASLKSADVKFKKF